MSSINPQRQSNIELLRIVAMLMVIILHSSFISNGAPTIEDIIDHPIGSAYFTLIEALTIVSVDCYILISGYFAIKPTLKKFLSLWFMIAFWRMSILVFAYFSIGHALTMKSVIHQFNIFGNGWFVGAYMALFVLAYFLNIFCERSTKLEFKKGLVIYLCAMLALGWIIPGSYSNYFNFANGYSVFSFIGIYLIGRYIRLHIDITRFSISKTIGTYFGVGIINTALFMTIPLICASTLLMDTRFNWFVSYDNPLIILGAICLLLTFLKINVNSKIINWLAASSFAVFLIHTHPISMEYFKECARYIKSEYWPWAWLPIVTMFAVCVYTACTLFDQIRICLWRILEKIVSRLFVRPITNRS